MNAVVGPGMGGLVEPGTQKSINLILRRHLQGVARQQRLYRAGREGQYMGFEGQAGVEAAVGECAGNAAAPARTVQPPQTQ